MISRYLILILSVGCIIAIVANRHYVTQTIYAFNRQGSMPATVSDTTIKDSSYNNTVKPAIKIYPPPPIGLKKVGYLLDFRSPSSIPDIRFKQCNVIVFAFAYVNSKGIYFRHSYNLKAYSAKAHKYNCKILLGISGSNKMFANMTATDEKRTLLIKEIMQAVRTYNLHGVDVDWEFPSVRNKTADAFTAFLKQLSDSCHKDGKYYVSSAIAPGVSGGYRSAAISNDLLTGDWVDWFNVMVYDNFSERVPYIHHSDFNLSVRSFKYWLLKRGMPADKCVMGLPLYGRPSGIKQAGHVKTFAAIMQNGGNAYRDSCIYYVDTSKTKYTLPQYILYYDGIITIQRKTLGAVEYGGGIMFWEIGQDINSRYSLIAAATSVVDEENIKRHSIKHHIKPGKNN